MWTKQISVIQIVHSYNIYINDHIMFYILLDLQAWELWKAGAGLALKDPTLGDSCHEDQLLRCIHIGLLCVEENGADRPTMLDVISMLTNESMLLPKPTKPAFCIERKEVRTGTVGNGSETLSVNTMSNSGCHGR